MGSTYSNIFVRTVDRKRLIGAVSACGRDAYLVIRGEWSVLVPKIRVDARLWTHLTSLGRECSSSLSTIALVCFVYDSDDLLMSLWKKGTFLGGYVSSEDSSEGAFAGISAEMLCEEFGRSEALPKLTEALVPRPSKRHLQTSIAKLSREFEGNWESEEFHRRMMELATSQLDAPRSSPFVFAEDRHSSICEILGVPLDCVGVRHVDIRTGEAEVEALKIEGSRTRRYRQPR